MTAENTKSSHREINELELTSDELDQVSGGSTNDVFAAYAAVAQAQAQGVVRIGGR